MQEMHPHQTGRVRPALTYNDTNMGKEQNKLESAKKAIVALIRAGLGAFHDPDKVEDSRAFGQGVSLVTRNTRFLVEAAAEHCEDRNDHAAAARLVELAWEMGGGVLPPRATREDIDDRIDAWHATPPEEKDELLHRALGLTWAEYTRYAEKDLLPGEVERPEPEARKKSLEEIVADVWNSHAGRSNLTGVTLFSMALEVRHRLGEPTREERERVAGLLDHWAEEQAVGRDTVLVRKVRQYYFAMVRNVGTQSDYTFMGRSHGEMVSLVAAWCRKDWDNCCPGEEMPDGPDANVVDAFFHGHHLTLVWDVVTVPSE